MCLQSLELEILFYLILIFFIAFVIPKVIIQQLEKTVGHITTMGNSIEPTEKEIERRKKE